MRRAGVGDCETGRDGVFFLDRLTCGVSGSESTRARWDRRLRPASPPTSSSLSTSERARRPRIRVLSMRLRFPGGSTSSLTRELEARGRVRCSTYNTYFQRNLAAEKRTTHLGLAAYRSGYERLYLSCNKPENVGEDARGLFRGGSAVSRSHGGSRGGMIKRQASVSKYPSVRCRLMSKIKAICRPGELEAAKARLHRFGTVRRGWSRRGSICIWSCCPRPSESSRAKQLQSFISLANYVRVPSRWSNSIITLLLSATTSPQFPAPSFRASPAPPPPRPHRHLSLTARTLAIGERDKGARLHGQGQSG